MDGREEGERKKGRGSNMRGVDGTREKPRGPGE